MPLRQSPASTGIGCSDLSQVFGSRQPVVWRRAGDHPGTGRPTGRILDGTTYTIDGEQPCWRRLWSSIVPVWMHGIVVYAPDDR